ncbi:zinc finger BED domain-containing protein RICESLEEPER 2-like [Corylus avellana]|uniref:zinc finger BED domain-containing protein RICESLEEPER 2-like n=1 Tax=Corylus avellana TaxID=13451 RepID=UPI00286D37EE|nr:zinc finger BED domain-containing protein RICESLEEPER 2-like [Corylus avellana]XP_059446002.1 zinc finger BED domain-containing protein RICESLEEPER 2-like [Corylus avellana]
MADEELQLADSNTIEEEYENEDEFEINLGANIDEDTNSVTDSNAEVTPIEAHKRKDRKRTSYIWNHFVEVDEGGGVKKNQCKWCKTKFSISKSSTTSTMVRHLKKCFKYLGSKKQRTLSVDVSDNITSFNNDETRVRELCAHMILYHEYPFMLLEHEIFNKFMKACTPHWKRISRVTAKTLCFATYDKEKKKLKTLLSKVHKVNITTDMWTSCQKVSYMVVTCHYIDEDWRLNRRVLNFCNIPPPHSGHTIAEALHKSFRDWGIENKICSITVDNANANDVAMRHIRDVFNLGKLLVIGGKLFHVRCVAHVTNLMVQDGLAEIGDIVDCVRDGIKYLVASEGRLVKFASHAKNLQLSKKKLFLDVPTRWNSTYMMLATALEFREVFPMYGYNDQIFTWVPSHEDWVKVEHVCEILGVFNRTIKIVSGSDYPTANLFLPEVWRMKQVLTKKSEDENEYIRSMAQKMKLKFDKYWSECNLLMSIAAILDPRFKMMLIRFCFPIIYKESEATSNIELVEKSLKEIYDVYVNEHNSNFVEQNLQSIAQRSSSHGASSSVAIGEDDEGGMELYESFLRTTNTVQKPIKSDLEIYLEEGIYIPEKGLEFSALDWWKTNTLKYRILSKVAKDILSIPITTVTSESTFSAGERVIDPHRASLSTETVQVLLCGADWVRALYGLKKKSAAVDHGEVEINLPEA